MRKTAATILILGAAWIGYTAWPVYDLLVLVRAIETRDVDTLTRHVYFDAVRASLTNQNRCCLRATHRNPDQSTRTTHGRLCSRRSSREKTDFARSPV